MSIRTVSEEPYTIVQLPERVDVTNTQELLSTVRGVMGKKCDLFILDMSKTEAVDSTALGAIVSLYKSLRVGEGDLMLAGVREGVQRVLALTRLDTVFVSHATIAAAKSADARAL